mmetsp:Transcript_633/g.1303  ORF Transcript_633/g.1303 Transcript_633/m.1303 type:complete len:298 (+) Transcript_633:69-962(+)|eukprot:CAMPEP_0178437696 /NCGR_PEP_ID=MMETSP0689_2-20121128/35151_1 /TAXON_ID=160604 /ORGANISM="Amphidinium massartii, Strain CS-259" /LENGTH=297 /DNA_ID=CAMNT_0020059957 /DNA_START=48 /DNA_END=941 /DNA_ORIENTATION=-
MISYPPRLFEHEPSDHQLYKDVAQVVDAPPVIVSHFVSTRTKQDKEQLAKIMSHLPTVKSARRAGGAAANAEEPMSERSASKSATPRSQAITPRSTTPRSTVAMQAGSAVLGSSTAGGALGPGAAESQARFEPSLFPGSLEWKMHHMRKPTERDEQMEQECRVRVKLQLARAGIDPDGHTAGELLQHLYTRHGSTYQAMTSEANRLTEMRAGTPRSFKGVLRQEAEAQIREARDLPSTMVSQHLDQHEIAHIGDVCRSFRHFDEKACGSMSEYTLSFTPRGYQERTGRQPKVLPPAV